MTIEFNVTASGDGQNRDKLTRDQTYIALITKNFCTEDKCVGEMRDAKAMGLPMYAILDDKLREYGELPLIIRDMPWKKIIVFTNPDQIPLVAEILKREIIKDTIK